MQNDQLKFTIDYIEDKTTESQKRKDEYMRRQEEAEQKQEQE